MADRENKKRLDLMWGQKYGSAQDPKTAWKRVGTVFVGEDTGRISMKIDMMPTGREFDGWLTAFEPRDDDNRAQGTGKRYASNSDDLNAPSDPVTRSDGTDIGQEPINLDDIPF